jgi:mRNA interferase HigB
MRIIKPKTLRAFWQREPRARPGLEHWYRVARQAAWACLADVRSAFGHADQVTVRSGRRVVVFNIVGNSFRLVTVIPYNRQIVFVLTIMTHTEAELDKAHVMIGHLEGQGYHVDHPIQHGW